MTRLTEEALFHRSPYRPGAYDRNMTDTERLVKMRQELRRLRDLGEPLPTGIVGTIFDEIIEAVIKLEARVEELEGR
jgi:hypothetical protein